MRVTVTGGAGFIGSHLVEALLLRGDVVQVIDDLSRGQLHHVPLGAHLARLDICGPQAAEALVDFAPQAVVHLAAQMDVGASVRAPLTDAHVNVLGTLNVIQASVAAGAEVLVAASSGGAIYGDAAVLPTSEDAPCAPRSPYGASKQCSEVYLALVARTQGLRTVALRLSNVYGPRQSHEGESGVVAIFAERMLRGMPLTVFGDGQQTRDFIYVTDVVGAILRCLDVNAARGCYNVATATATSLLSLIEALEAGTGKPTVVLHAAAKAHEVRHSALRCTRLTQATAWSARTSLLAGIRHSVVYMQAHMRAREQKPRRHGVHAPGALQKPDVVRHPLAPA